MTARQVKEAKEQVEREVERILNFLASMPAHGNTTTTQPVVRALLLKTDGVLLAHGQLHNIVAKHLSAGIYRVRLEPQP